MSIIQAIIFGLVQGLTEFIPVSSSGHLVLLHEAFGVTGGLSFDVALHLGTLGALLLYFYRDIVALIKSVFSSAKEARLAKYLVLATIPAIVSGFLLESAAESAFRSSRLVSMNLIVVALVMIFVERAYIAKKAEKAEISGRSAAAMGFAQALAVVPGVSRSGATITAGMAAGLSRAKAARFSFLLAIPITTGAAAKVLLDGAVLRDIRSEWAVFAVGIVTALLSGLFAIRFLLDYLSKRGLAVFAWYRIALGVAVLLFYS